MRNAIKSRPPQASFQNALVLSPNDDGRHWRIMKEYGYDVGFIGSKERITVPVGFITDFASVPRLFWMFTPPWGRYGKAAIVHDYLYLQGHYDRLRADEIFLEIMLNSGTTAFVRMVFYYMVRVFGKSGFHAGGTP